MRVTYRQSENKEYWASRWGEIPADIAMANREVYPLKYALETVVANDGPILEAGCGAGRVLRYYHGHGYDITGIDFIEVAIDKLREVDPSLKVETGDITGLRFADGYFRYLLAFGLYHNLEDSLDEAVSESWRVLEQGGRLCASFRADNLQTRLTDLLAAAKARNRGNGQGKAFHKRNLTRREFSSLFERAGFIVDSVRPVENMPILYKFSSLRAVGHKRFDENKARAEGYQLSRLGNLLQRLLMRFFPDQVCNVYVLIATKA